MSRQNLGKTGRHQRGSAHSKSGQSHAADFGPTGGESALFEAKTFLQESLGLDGTESWSFDAFGRERRREVACLESWASDNGFWLPAETFRERRRGGQEHDLVLVGEPALRVMKLTKGGFFGTYPHFDKSLISGNISDRFQLQPGTPHQYLCRLLLQNQLVPSLNTFDGFTTINGQFVIVTSQPFFNGDAAKEDKIRTFFSRAGFRSICTGAWYRQCDNVAVFDAVPSNILNCGGRLIPFDTIPLRPAGDFRKCLKTVMK